MTVRSDKFVRWVALSSLGYCPIRPVLMFACCRSQANTELDGKLSGGAMRVPVSDGSLVDLVLELSRNVSVEELNNCFKNNVNETLEYTMDPIVSSDMISSTCGACVDGNLTSVVEVEGRQLVKVVAWYDNEMGYSSQMVRTARKI